MGIESSRKRAMNVRMSWMSVGWAISGASGGLDLPKSCLNTSISAGIYLHDHGRFLAQWTRRILQISIDPLAAIDVFRVLQS